METPESATAMQVYPGTLGDHMWFGYSRLDCDESLTDVELCEREPISESEAAIKEDPLLAKSTCRGNDSSKLSFLCTSACAR